MTTAAADPVPLATGRPLVWYEPHQDDGTLWAGQILAHHALVGREVHLVCGSDGSTSRIRDAINGQESNGWWGGYHFPEREGIPYLSPADFAAARDRELMNASVQLGIRPEHVHLELDRRGPTLSVSQAEALIRRYEDLYPGAGHYTTHWTDPDPTHAALGTALRNLALYEPETFKDCRWVIRRSQIGTVAGAVEYVVPASLATQAVHMTRCAAKAFGAWAPDPEPDPAKNKGLYGIAHHSVAPDFAAVGRGESNWIVKTP